MAGHRGQNEIELFAEQQRLAIERQIVIDIAQQLFRIGPRNGVWQAAYEHCPGPETFDRKPVFGKPGCSFLEPVAAGFVEFDHFGDQQRLAARDRFFGARSPQAFEYEPFMRRVLVDQYQPVLRLGDDIGVGDLTAGNAQGIVRRGRIRRYRFLGPATRFGHGAALASVPGPARLGHAGGRRGPVAPFEDRAQRGRRLLAHGFLLPARHGTRVGALRAALVARRQRAAQARDDEAAHALCIAEPHLGLGGVDVHVDFFCRQVEEQRQHRVAIPREHVGIGAADCTGEQAVLHRAAVDEQILVVGHAAIVGRQARDPGQAHVAAVHVDRDAVVLELARDQLRDAVGQPFPALQREDSPLAVIEADRHVGPRHGKPHDHVLAGGVFAPRRAQELAPRGDLAEQVFDPHPRAGR